MASEQEGRAPSGGAFVVMKGVDLTIGNRTILDHVDLEVRRGELLALVGANGAGKSSILRCMAGMWRQTAGLIEVDGLDRTRDDLAIRRFTAYLPPEPSLPMISIRESVRLFAEAYGVDEETWRRRMDALLRMFDLKERQNANTIGLSKGEAKNACLACVLVTGAKLYILDEPFTGGIDPRGYDAFRRVLERLASNRELTAVFATQVLDMAAALADRIAVVNYGRILAVGTVAELREKARVGADAPFEEAFARLASRDSDVPVAEFMAALEEQR